MSILKLLIPFADFAELAFFIGISHFLAQKLEELATDPLLETGIGHFKMATFSCQSGMYLAFVFTSEG